MTAVLTALLTVAGYLLLHSLCDTADRMYRQVKKRRFLAAPQLEADL